MVNGLFIALEGLDGSGTTTQLGRLGAYLRGQGREAHLTAEPSTGLIGEVIRRILVGNQETSPPALALLFAADRLDHVHREIEPALERGAVVVSDRYVLSSIAYQSLGAPREWVANLNDRARVPDATFFFRISPDTAAARRKARGGRDELFDASESQHRVAAAYEEALGMPQVGSLHVLDAEKDIASITDELCRATDALLEAR